MESIVIDLEATCWDHRVDAGQTEIIEIGAIDLSATASRSPREFSRIVRPVAEPTLSPFCTELTGIVQRDVDAADTFPTVFAAFLDWCGADRFRLCSWGAYDIQQLARDCRRHRLKLAPGLIKSHVNLKENFAHRRRMRPVGMKGALELLRIPLAGRHHRGIDDVRNIVTIIRRMPEILEGDTR